MNSFDLIGLPESGKSTFLAALWFLLNRGSKDDCGWEAFLDEFESKYLDELVNKWISYIPFGRTGRGSEADIDLRLKSRSDGATIDLRIPDVAGERLQDIWIYRTSWSLGDEPTGYVLFLNPSERKVPVLLDARIERETDAIVGEEQSNANTAPRKEAANPTEAGAVGDSQPFNWEPQNDPSQIQITYILQELESSRRAAGLKSIPLSVVVSAWDLVPRLVKKCADPATAVEALYPLLSGYLKASTGFAIRFFGVSAQGGPYPGLAAKRAKLHNHIDRISITDGSGSSRDLTKAFDWMLT